MSQFPQKANSLSNPAYWINIIDEQFRKKNYRHARDFILKALTNFPNHPLLLDRLFIVDQRWNLPIAGNKIHLVIPFIVTLIKSAVIQYRLIRDQHPEIQIVIVKKVVD